MLGKLDTMSSKLRQSETAACVFDEIGRCSPHRDFGIICRNHADQIIALALIKDVVNVATHESVLYKLVSTEPRQIFLPFPYTFEVGAGGNVDSTQKPCIQKDILQTKTAEFVTQMNLQSPELQHNVLSALMSLFVDGAVYFQSTPRATLNFQMYCTPNLKAYLQKRWEAASIYVKRTVDGIERYQLYPMNQMPLFYQIIFSYCTLSGNVLQDRPNATSEEMYQSLSPNIILNADLNQFEFVNNKEPNPIYLHRNNSTFATPLVLAGVQYHKHKIELFKQNSIFYDFTFDNIPGFCSVNNRGGA